MANEAGRHDWKLGLVVLVDYFLMNLFLIGRGLSHIKPVNFVIQEMMSEPSVLFFFSVLLAGSVVIAVPSLFACFGCMVEQKTFTESMKRSRKLLKGHRFLSLIHIWSRHGTISSAIRLSMMSAPGRSRTAINSGISARVWMGLLLSLIHI